MFGRRIQQAVLWRRGQERREKPSHPEGFARFLRPREAEADPSRPQGAAGPTAAAGPPPRLRRKPGPGGTPKTLRPTGRKRTSVWTFAAPRTDWAPLEARTAGATEGPNRPPSKGADTTSALPKDVGGRRSPFGLRRRISLVHQGRSGNPGHSTSPGAQDPAMAQAVVAKGDPQGTPEKDGPTGRRVGRAMVHLQRTDPMAGTGHDKDAEASHAEDGG